MKRVAASKSSMEVGATVWGEFPDGMRTVGGRRGFSRGGSFLRDVPLLWKVSMPSSSSVEVKTGGQSEGDGGEGSLRSRLLLHPLGCGLGGAGGEFILD